jgi:hypothetical protein
MRAVKSSENLSGFLARHRLRAFVITVAVIVMVASAMIQAFGSAPRGIETITWVFLGAFVWIAGVVVFGGRYLRSQVRLDMRFRMGMTPMMFGTSAFIIGSPPWVLWVGAVTSIGLAGWTLATAD